MSRKPVDWRKLGETPPESLEDARNQLHWAAQVVASVGFTYLDPVPDFSHTSMEWLPEHGALAGGWAGEGKNRFRTALVLEVPRLVIVTSHGVKAALELAGRPMDEVYRWMWDRCCERLGRGLAGALVRPDHEIPHHAVGSGEPFSAEPAPAFKELARWYGAAAIALGEVQADNAGASPLRCWPHHFDIATLISLDPGEDPETARSIGVGMTPGDTSYPEPYFYVNPWPRPADPGAVTLPELPSGGWHMEGWFGAVLQASEVVAAGSAKDQERLVRSFLSRAVEADLEIMGRRALG